MKSRLIKKSQMYEHAHDHGFGNNVYLYSVSGNFLGICKNENDVIVAAILKKPEIARISYMMDNLPVERFIEAANRVPNPHTFYEERKLDIWWVKKTFKEVYAKESKRAKYNKWQVIKIHDRYNRLVFDEDTHTFIQLHIIPQGFKIELTRVPFDKYTHINKYRKMSTTITQVDMVLFDFTRYICDNDDRREATGHIMLPHTNKKQECFKTTHVGVVIKKLEKLGFTFVKNDLYKLAINIYDNTH